MEYVKNHIVPHFMLRDYSDEEYSCFYNKTANLNLNNKERVQICKRSQKFTFENLYTIGNKKFYDLEKTYSAIESRVAFIFSKDRDDWTENELNALASFIIITELRSYKVFNFFDVIHNENFNESHGVGNQYINRVKKDTNDLSFIETVKHFAIFLKQLKDENEAHKISAQLIDKIKEILIVKKQEEIEKIKHLCLGGRVHFVEVENDLVLSDNQVVNIFKKTKNNNLNIVRDILFCGNKKRENFKMMVINKNKLMILSKNKPVKRIKSLQFSKRVNAINIFMSDFWYIFSNKNLARNVCLVTYNTIKFQDFMRSDFFEGTELKFLSGRFCAKEKIINSINIQKIKKDLKKGEVVSNKDYSIAKINGNYQLRIHFSKSTSNLIKSVSNNQRKAILKYIENGLSGLNIDLTFFLSRYTVVELNTKSFKKLYRGKDKVVASYVNTQTKQTERKEHNLDFILSKIKENENYAIYNFHNILEIDENSGKIITINDFEKRKINESSNHSIVIDLN